MIERNYLLSLFEELIQIDSPSFRERRMGDVVTEKLKSLGIPVREDGAADVIGGSCGNLYGYLEGDLDLPPLLFCAHLDTVEPSQGKRMRIDEDGVITSQGETILGADDCAGLASILEAIRALKVSGLSHRPIEVLFTVAEEPYCRGAQALDSSLIRSHEAYVFDLSGPVGQAAYEAPTILSFRIVFTGRSSHAGFSPEEGIHAIRAAACAIAEVPCGRIGEATLNFGTISGGIADNIVPESCFVTGEIRSCSDGAAKELFARTSRTIQRIAQEHGAKAQVSHRVEVTAYRTEPESRTAKRFQSACRGLGLSGRLLKTFGGSDNNYLAQQGIKGLVVANAMNNCHSTDEYTTADELERSAKLALALMLSKE